jgi:hypothetical protein
MAWMEYATTKAVSMKSIQSVFEEINELGAEAKSIIPIVA